MSAILKLLIANRGEIACRIMRTARARGIATVAVFSDADARALHVRAADEAIHIGGSAPALSYLNVEAIIAAAKKAGADAIHPGYGFLSERAEFAHACADAGLIFVGPPPDAIAAMGDKASSKELMIAAGVSCVPGYQGEDQTDSRLTKEVASIGFPMMVKASAGGGGRGMRIVHEKAELADAIASARKEAISAFGDGRLLLERAVVGARHVEVQVFADAHGNCIYLGERDCSLQRRNQKVIEEAPSPVIDATVRADMGAAAVKAAQAVGYVGAGTVEFLYDVATREFYFLEMNTRLQVEHPVTEMVTGLDLVALQLDIAEGRPLSQSQEDVRTNGWAMEARLYAEDPAQGFMPQSGEVTLFEFPTGGGERVDSGVETGDMVSAFYDPMLAKVIAHGETRDEARRKLASALRQTTLFGFAHNRDFLVSLLEDEVFAKGDADTGHVERNLDKLAARKPLHAGIALVGAASIDLPFGGLLTGWRSRGAGGFPLRLVTNEGAAIEAYILVDGSVITSIVGGDETSIEVLSTTPNRIRYCCGGRVGEARFARHYDQIEIQTDDSSEQYLDVTLAASGSAGVGEDFVKAPTAGLVTGVRVQPGDVLSKGMTVATVEAMKMEHQLKAPRDGVVADVLVKPGEQVAIRAKLIELESEA